MDLEKIWNNDSALSITYHDITKVFDVSLYEELFGELDEVETFECRCCICAKSYSSIKASQICAQCLKDLNEST
jgi:hypothetical protein